MMFKKYFFLLILFILFLSLFNVFFTVEIIHAKNSKTIFVGGSGIGNYSSIQDAINNSNINDNVFVYNGTYNENLIINKSVNLIGFEKNTTIIQGNRSLYIVMIKSSWINISGFTIQNGKVGIYISGSNYSNNNISNNAIIDNWEGIRLFNSSNNEIYKNVIVNQSNQGIIMYDSRNNIISNNNFYNNHKAILLDRWSDKNKIYKNNITSRYFGISIDTSFKNYVYNNDILNCTRGVYLTYSKNNNITNNNFELNRECGIYLISSRDNIIEPNSFLDNRQDVKQGPEPPKIKAPGFEIIIVFCAMIIFLIFKKKLKKY